MKISKRHRDDLTILSRRVIPIAIAGLVAIIACGRKTDEGISEVILAKIGDKTISATEFYRRAEYTIRPPYCKLDNYIHKKIILNSLIAEKLFALEAGKDNDMVRFPRFQQFIKGRREQEMRKWLYRKEGVEKVKLDSSEIAKAYRFAGRTVEVAFFSVPTEEMAAQVAKTLEKSNRNFEQTFRATIAKGDIPTKEVEWQKEGNDVIHEALFSDSLVVGQIFGPLEAEDGLFTTIKVLGWKDRVAVTELQQQQRWEDVKNRLTSRKALSYYSDFAGRVMRGKKVEFVESSFFKLAEFLQPFYLKTQDDLENAFTEKYWENRESEEGPENISGDIEAIRDEPILQIDGEIWSVADLIDEMAVHPLVFRKKKMNSRIFPEQFKLAIVDLIRDKYLTEVAYDRGYDQINAVQRIENMWSDHIVSLFQRDQVLKKLNISEDFSKEYLGIIERHLNTYVDSLQRKYDDVIEIDTDVFEKLKLTRIDLFVTEQNVPYPVASPSFPILTTDNRLDYGRKMEKEPESTSD